MDDSLAELPRVESLDSIMYETDDTKRHQDFYNMVTGEDLITLSKTLDRILEEEPASMPSYLSYVYKDGFEKVPPFIAACRGGKVPMVRLLIEKLKVQPQGYLDLEQTACVFFESFEIHGATALWCASGEGHLDVVQLLVESGAKVNHATDSQSIPLRTASFSGHTEVVRYLVEKGADLNKTNRYKNTSLMVSAYQGHGDVVQLLLEKGADANLTDIYGSTCLHEAAQNGHVDIVKTISSFSAVHVRDNNNVTPLLAAADNSYVEVVEHMVDDATFVITAEEKADAFELLGASFANNEEHYSLAEAAAHLRRGMQVRCDARGRLLHPKRPLVDTYPAYEHRVEAADPAALEERLGDPDDLHYEALLVRERILGPESELLPADLIYRGDVFADAGRFDRCQALWMRALELTYDMDRSIGRDLLAFIQIYCEMKLDGQRVPFQQVELLLQYYLEELKRDVRRIHDDVPVDQAGLQESDTLQGVYATNLVNLVNLLAFTLQLDLESAQLERLRHVAYRLRAEGQLGDSKTLLDICLDSSTVIEGYKVSSVVSYPNYDVMRLLLESGHDINRKDGRYDDQTPLHRLAQNVMRTAQEVQDAGAALRCLQGHCCHWHVANSTGDYPLHLLQRHNTEQVVAQLGPYMCPWRGVSLKCLAVVTLLKHQVPYRGLVPSSLEDFIRTH